MKNRQEPIEYNFFVDVQEDLDNPWFKLAAEIKQRVMVWLTQREYDEYMDKKWFAKQDWIEKKAIEMNT